MSTIERGSMWKKWDLHVHTPESIVHNYPGEKEAAWQAFLSDLEALPPEFKVLGINDYLFTDGYERVLDERQKGRLSNIDLILPVIELRIDKFGGILETGSGRSYSSSSWSRINVHVIFDAIDVRLIRDQFMPAISRRYTLVPGTVGNWGGVITRENLIALGDAIIESLPEHVRANAPSPLKMGFNNLNVHYEGLIEALENPLFAGKFLVAIGKTEWDELRWNDNTIADKKSTINNADLVFTSAENPELYMRARNALKTANVNAKLLDCSDAHALSCTTVKDRIGNCFTWIKADSTFQGLLQAIEEFEDRVYVGDNPPKRKFVEQNKTKFIRSVRVAKNPDSTLSEPWFDANIPLNPDLVAIIGNKGSGKSALADIIALAGNTRNHASFSFLKQSRFRSNRTRFAQHFIGTLIWKDDSVSARDLDKDPELSSVERVKYLPQSYLEQLCNDLGEKGSNTFDTELRKIIYSHVPKEDRLGKSSMDELLEYKVAEIDHARKVLRAEVSEVNKRIIEAERRLTPEFKASLDERLLARKSELAALDASKPPVVEDPNISIDAQEESKQAVAKVELLERQIQDIGTEEISLLERKSAAVKRYAVATRIMQALVNQQKQFDGFLGELKPLLDELGGISVDTLIQLRIDNALVKNVANALQVEIEEIESKLHGDASDSIVSRRERATSLINAAKAKLGERQRQYVLYKEELAKWERAKLEIVGELDKPGTIAWLAAELESLATLPNYLGELQSKRNHLAKEIYGQIQAMVNEYQRLYGPVQTFVQSAEQMDMSLPLKFHVRIEEAGFEEKFFNLLNRQVRGTFSGVEEGGQRLSEMLQETNFTILADAVAFAEQIDRLLHVDERDGQLGRATRLADQLRKGVDPIDMLDYLFGFDYLLPRYSLTYSGQEIGQLSPGERGLLLLVFYLLVDKDNIPIVIDQPEENLDNQTIFNILVKCIKKAKEHRQVIMVTHNPNLAVVCDAEQIIYASCDKQENRFDYESGAVEHPEIKARVVQILEGTEPAFKNRQAKYRLQ